MIESIYLDVLLSSTIMLTINGDYAMGIETIKGNEEITEVRKIKISITARLLGFTIISLFAVMLIVIKIATPKAVDLEVNAVKDNMLNLAISYGKLIDESLEFNNGHLTEDQYKEMLKDVSVGGYTSGTAYVVDYNGITLYHRNISKIGSPADSSVIQQLVATVTDIAEGSATNTSLPSPEVTTYTVRGNENYIAYHISPVDYSILVISLEATDINETISAYKTSLYTVAIIVCIICILIGVVICYFVIKPLNNLVTITERLSHLELASDELSEKLINRNDECGEIARSIANVKKEITNVVYELAEVSNTIHANSVNVRNISSFISSEASENSITTDALESNIQITFSTTGAIDNSINNIQKKTGNIEVAARQGNELANQIIDKAVVLKADTDETIKETHTIYKDIKEKSSVALEKAKAVDKIQALADAIRNISSQTSMLALNASIEAARAGEMGRGFAVVADEIGILASQSTDTVDDIGNIVIEIKDAVNEMIECLNFTVEFLENTVTHDLEAFKEIGNEYSTDAKIFDEKMSEINGLSKDLTRSIHDIVYAIDGINKTIGEASIGITDLSGKTTEIVDSSLKSDKILLTNEEYAEKLQTIIKKFRY